MMEEKEGIFVIKKFMSLTLAMILSMNPGGAVPRQPEPFGCVLCIDAEEIGACEDRKELGEIWKSAQASILPEGAELACRMTIVHRVVEPWELCEPEEFLLRIREKLRYTVTEYETESFSAPVQRVEDETMPEGREEVLVPGEEGLLQVARRITYLNGERIRWEALSTSVVREAVPKQVAVGTGRTGPTGTYRFPVEEIRITSDFGPRSSGYHTGVDFAAPLGTPVRASDGGTVIFTGWQGGYGNLVKLSHENGIETWYAHNSEITVEVGQELAQGDVIALVGSTGNSTGPHCHLEVRVNGDAENPWNYLPAP